jgi:hypothetical protein
MAEGLTKAQFEAQEKVIEADLKAAKAACVREAQVRFGKP